MWLCAHTHGHSRPHIHSCTFTRAHAYRLKGVVLLRVVVLFLTMAYTVRAVWIVGALVVRDQSLPTGSRLATGLQAHMLACMFAYINMKEAEGKTAVPEDDRWNWYAGEAGLAGYACLHMSRHMHARMPAYVNIQCSL